MRGGGRAGFLRRVLGGRHVFINRPPSEVVGSFASFGEASYFLAALVHILARNRTHPIADAIRRRLAALGPYDDAPLADLGMEGLIAAREIAAGLNRSQTALLATAFWLVYLLEGLAAADLVIDTERLAGSESHRAEMTPVLAPLFGPRVLQDFKAPRHNAVPAAPAAELRALLADCPRLRELAEALPPERLAALGDESRALVEASSE